MRILDLSPTPLFPRAAGAPEQIARLQLEGDVGGRLQVEASTASGRTSAAVIDIQPGEIERLISVPEIETNGAIHIRLLRGEELLAEATFACAPARKWTVYIMPTGHIDLYSTGLAHETPEEHCRMLDAALALAEERPEYRYQVENMLPLFEYRELRGEEMMVRLAARIREGQIGFGAQYTGVHMEETSGEELVQGQLLRMRELEAAYGIRPNCGYTVDVPNTTIQFAQLLARCGVPGWIFSPNRFPVPNGWYGLGESIRRLPRLSRMTGLDGSGVLWWLPHDHYGHDQALFGLDREGLDECAACVAGRLEALEGEGYAWDAYLLEHSYGDNLPPDGVLAERVAAWNGRYAYPRLVLATAGEFFAHVGQGPEPPEVRFEVLDVWAYIVANQGVLNQIARRAANRLLSAQALLAPGGGRYPEEAFREAFSELGKFAAHDWWYGGGQVAGVPDLAKAAWAHRAEEMARDLLPADGSSIANPCGFRRRDIAVLPAGADAAGQPADAETIATHFQPQPFTIAHPLSGNGEGGAVSLVDVPSLGGQGWGPERRGEDVQGTSPERRKHPVLENDFCRLEFDPRLGAIGSLIDRETGRELLDAGGHGLGAVLLGRPQYDGFGIGFGVPYEEGLERMKQSLKSWDACPLELDHSLQGPVFSSLVLRGRVHESPVRQAIILYRDLKRVDITVTIDWDNQPPASRLVIAFPFALSGFDCRYEVPFGVLEVGRDEAPTVPRQLRQLQTWLQFRQGDRSIVIASPDASVFSLGRCDLNPVDDAAYTVPERAHAYFVLADNGAFSPLVQPGRLAARFSLTTGDGLRPSDCARFGWGFARPLLTGADAPFGALELRPDNVLVSAVKRAFDGDGLVVRVVDYDGEAADCELRLPFEPLAARLADPAEHPLSPLAVDGTAVRFPIGPDEVLTIRIEAPPGRSEDLQLREAR